MSYQKNSDNLTKLWKTQEFRDAHKKAMQIRWQDPEYLARFTEMAKQSPSDETKAKMRDAKLGVTKTDEHRQAMRDTQKRVHKIFK